VNTLPGTNRYHGAAFEFLRNSYMDAARGRLWAKNPFRRNTMASPGRAGFDSQRIDGRNRLFSWLISQEFESRAMNRLVSGKVFTLIARPPAELGRINAGLHFEFLDRVHGRVNDVGIEVRVVFSAPSRYSD